MLACVSQLGVGLAALGRPGYITLGHGDDLAHDYDPAAMERRCHEVLDAAWAAGVRWFDAARSYGHAEQFLASWLRGAPLLLREQADRNGVGPDAIALAAALAQPFADVVLSGAVSPAQLADNLRARDIDDPTMGLGSLVEPPDRYWSMRAQLPWN
jgi:aryl-alcohol dehydrogenase-like predicted oxidoreductase